MQSNAHRVPLWDSPCWIWESTCTTASVVVATIIAATTFRNLLQIARARARARAHMFFPITSDRISLVDVMAPYPFASYPSRSLAIWGNSFIYVKNEWSATFPVSSCSCRASCFRSGNIHFFYMEMFFGKNPLSIIFRQNVFHWIMSLHSNYVGGWFFTIISFPVFSKAKHYFFIFIVKHVCLFVLVKTIVSIILSSNNKVLWCVCLKSLLACILLNHMTTFKLCSEPYNHIWWKSFLWVIQSNGMIGTNL